MSREDDKESDPPPPRSDSTGLSEALRKADQSQDGSLSDKSSKAISKALDEQKPPIFSTYSDGFLATCAAEEMRLKDIVADIDAKLAALGAERTNAMLAFSMVQAARLAREKGLSS